MEESDGLSAWPQAELKALCRKAGLNVGGTKEELVKRLRNAAVVLSTIINQRESTERDSTSEDEPAVLATDGTDITELVALVRDGTDEETESAVAAAHLLTDLDGDLLKELYKHVDVPFALKLVCHAMCDANPEPTVTKLRHVVSSVPLLSWAHDNGCPRTKWTCAWAACGGHAEVMLWASDNDWPWDDYTIREAGGIPPLVALVRDGNDAQKKEAADALWWIARCADNHILIAKAKREAGMKAGKLLSFF